MLDSTRVVWAVITYRNMSEIRYINILFFFLKWKPLHYFVVLNCSCLHKICPTPFSGVQNIYIYITEL